MYLIRSMHPLARAWLLDGPLSSYVDAFQDLLERGRYHPTTLRTRGDLSASLGHSLALLREQHVIVELPGPSGSVAEELTRYSTHMRDARGLAKTSLARRASAAPAATRRH